MPFFIVWLAQVSTTSGPGYETIEEATSAAESSAALRPAYTRKFVIVEASDPREALFKATGMPKPPGMR